MSSDVIDVVNGVARPMGAAERLLAARRMLEGIAWGGEDLWAGVSLADLPRVRSDARAVERAVAAVTRRLGMDAGKF